MDKDKITVELLCHHCKTPMEKRLKYLLNRVKKGKTLFFCSRRCADKHHSEAMKGENNPNYGGTFHGITSDKWTEEKRRKAAEKISKTMKEKGISKGANNPRWRGGRRKVSCIICGKEYTVPPHVYDKIQAGDRKPCCSNDCARIYALTQVKTERTSIEIKMAEELTRRGIEYIEQYNLGNKFALDFFLPEYNIVIECDGYY
jgi:YHS domain-containing protein